MRGAFLFLSILLSSFSSTALASLSFIKEGSQTRIFRETETTVIRIQRDPDSDTEWRFRSGIEALRREGVETVEVLGIPRDPLFHNDATRVRYVDEKFNLYQWLMLHPIGLPAERQVLEALLRFAQQSAQYRMIDDFHGKQLVYDGQRWLILDVHNQHVLDWDHRETLGKTIWDILPWSLYVKNSSPLKQGDLMALHARLNHVVETRRQELRLQGRYCAELFVPEPGISERGWR